MPACAIATSARPCLLPGFSGEAENVRLGDLARMLRTLSGRYDQAARAASAASL